MTCIVLFVLIVLVLWIGLVRNKEVYVYRGILINKLNNQAHVDIAQGLPWRWRRQEFYKVGYVEMVLKFWKPLNSFYKNTKFLER